MAWTPIRLRFRSGLVAFDGEAEGAGGGSTPDGAVWVFVYADAASADDAQGSNDDIALLLDSGTFIQKEAGTWASS